MNLLTEVLIETAVVHTRNIDNIELMDFYTLSVVRYSKELDVFPSSGESGGRYLLCDWN
jgi:hypothetical protein